MYGLLDQRISATSILKFSDQNVKTQAFCCFSMFVWRKGAVSLFFVNFLFLT